MNTKIISITLALSVPTGAWAQKPVVCVNCADECLDHSTGPFYSGESHGALEAAGTGKQLNGNPRSVFEDIYSRLCGMRKEIDELKANK